MVLGTEYQNLHRLDARKQLLEQLRGLCKAMDA